MNKIIQFIQDWFQKQTAEEKRRLLLICTGVFALLLTLSVIVSLFNKHSEKPQPQAPERLIINSPIPAGELFIPEEPDFLPGILLGREQRSGWTEDDASEFWQDPLKQGEEQWRKKIETSMDELWERVP